MQWLPVLKTSLRIIPVIHSGLCVIQAGVFGGG